MDLVAAFDLQLFIKGTLTVLMGFALFIGSVYLLLKAVFGAKMGYLVLAIAFFTWMIFLSSLWAFGFYTQGLETPANLGPKGPEPSWVVIEGGFTAASEEFPEVAEYPAEPWKEPAGGALSSVEPTKVTVATFLAEEANAELGIEVVEPVPAHAGGTEVEAEPAADTGGEANAQEATGAAAEAANQTPFIPEDFVVEDVKYATASDGTTSLAVARGFYENGGPVFTVALYHSPGNVGIYSYIFLAVSIIGLLVHIPFLDRAEASRKEILTGGKAPVWRGPA